jgi:hypothetical protein
MTDFLKTVTLTVSVKAERIPTPRYAKKLRAMQYSGESRLRAMRHGAESIFVVEFSRRSPQIRIYMQSP